MKRIWLALALLAGCAVVEAQPATKLGTPVVAKPLLDRDFGVSTRQFGLEREVQTYQWRASGDISSRGGPRGGDANGGNASAGGASAGEASVGEFRRVWNSARIDSSQFPATHQNPPAAAIDSQRWWAQRATLDGKPIAPDVLRALGSWQRFRPDFDRLPANLAASFQPEGDGLGSSDNPLAPQIGDLRVRWRELVLPDLAGKVEIRDGVWQLTRAAAVAPARAEQLIELPGDPQLPLREVWPWLAGTIAALAALWLALRRRRDQRDDRCPP